MRTLMKIPGRRTFLALAVCLLGCLVSPALSASDFRAETSAGALDLALRFSHSDLDLKSAGTTYPVDFNRVDVLLINESYGGLDFGLILGNTYLSLHNDSPSAGVGYSGSHLGFLVRRQFDTHPRLITQAYYLFQQVGGDSPDNTLDLDWHEWQLAASLRFGLGANLGLIMGAAYNDVDAEQRISGATNLTRDLTLEDNLQGSLELEMLTSGDGRVSVAITGGGHTGIGISFGRLF